MALAKPEELGPTFSVIMPFLDAIEFLPASIAALLEASRQGPTVELILVDNGSTDGSVEWVQKHPALQVRLLSHPGLNVGALRNRGAMVARGRYLSFIDADCVVSPDYFHQALATIESSGADAVGCYYQLPPHPTRLEAAWDALHAPHGSGFVRMLNAGNFLIRRDAFESVGGFDPLLVTGEDAELGLRLHLAGFTMFESPAIVAIHMGNPATLWQFFRKELWHARGMFGTARLQKLDKPLMMTLAHLLAVAAASYVIVRGELSPAALLGASLLAIAVPVAAVMYRTGFSMRQYPFLGILLYLAYFTARVCALPAAIVDTMTMRYRRSAIESRPTHGSAT